MSSKKRLTSLICLAKGLVNRYILVDLRNDASVNGKITEVDDCMNITISDAIFTDACGNEYHYDEFFIRERNIRYIHLPSEEDIDELLVKSLEMLTHRRKPVQNLKTSRLMQRQMETLKRVEEIKRKRQEAKELMAASSSLEK